MAIWYEVEKTDSGIRGFLDCVAYFHDYKIERIRYDPDNHNAEVFFKYDKLEGSMIIGVTVHSWLEDYIFGAVLLRLDNGNMLWINDGRFGEESSKHIEELKADSSWIEAERIIWAVTDENGNPAEMPDHMIDQTWITYGKETRHHFDLKPYEE